MLIKNNLKIYLMSEPNSIVLHCWTIKLKPSQLYAMIATVDLVTVIAVGVRLWIIYKRGRFDELIFASMTMLGALLQLLSAIGYTIVENFRRRQLFSFHYSAKLVFLLFFVIESLIKDSLECFLYDKDSRGKCQDRERNLGLYVALFISEIFLSELLRALIKTLREVDIQLREPPITLNAIPVDINGIKCPETSLKVPELDTIPVTYLCQIESSNGSSKVIVLPRKQVAKDVMIEEIEILIE